MIEAHVITTNVHRLARLAAIALLPLLPALEQLDHLLVLEHSLVATSALCSFDGEAAELVALDCDGGREGEESGAQHLVEHTCSAGAKLCGVLRVRREEVARAEIVHFQSRVLRGVVYEVLLRSALDKQRTSDVVHWAPNMTV